MTRKTLKPAVSYTRMSSDEIDELADRMVEHSVALRAAARKVHRFNGSQNETAEPPRTKNGRKKPGRTRARNAA